ncbi:MAG: hypothetical protein KDD69_00385 [Bdellovibrionales bacterium]|nr:hypothetical protein [Bdellovibrionales bacterium]
MIDNRVAELAGGFLRVWRPLAERFPSCRLDLSWPSVGTLGLLLSPLRAKAQLADVDRLEIAAAAAYIGGIAYDVWSQFPGNPTIELRLEEQGEVPEVMLVVGGGSHIPPGQRLVLRLRAALEQWLGAKNTAVPVFADGARTLTLDDNVLSIFGSALLSGLMPAAEGPWRGLSLNEFAPELQSAAEWMAESSAVHYQMTHPSELHGASRVLYFPHLVLPPAGYNERYLGCRPAAALCDYLRKFVPEHGDRVALCENLAIAPDDLISMAGFVVSAALSDEAPDATLRAVAYSRRFSATLLRKALYLARTLLGRKESWIEHYRARRFDQAGAMLLRERDLGMLPLWYLDELHWLNHPTLSQLFDLLAETRLAEANDLLDFYSALELPAPELTLQRIFLKLTLGKQDTVAQLLADIEPQLGTLSPNSRFKFHELVGLLAERQGRTADSVEAYTRALAVPGADSFRVPIPAFRLAQHYLSTNESDKATRALEQVLRINPGHSDARVSLFLLLTEKRPPESAESHSLLSAAPRHGGALYALRQSL